MTDTDTLPAAHTKIDRAIRLLEAALCEKSESPRSDVRIALEELRSARDDLAGIDRP